MRPDMLRRDRRQLVGLLAPEVLEEGAQLVADATAPLPHARARHVGVLERNAAASDRAGAAVRWPRADRPDALRADGGRHHRGACDGSRRSTTGRAGGCMAERAHPLAAAAAGSPDCRCGAARGIAAGDAADHSRRCGGDCHRWTGTAWIACRAIHVSAAIALLWLGPDEFLLLAIGRVPATRAARQHRRRIASRHRTDGVRAARGLGDQCILCARSASRRVPGRHVHAHGVRQRPKSCCGGPRRTRSASRWRDRSHPMSGRVWRRRGASSSSPIVIARRRSISIQGALGWGLLRFARNDSLNQQNVGRKPWTSRARSR